MRTETRTADIYIAGDGTEFTSKAECLSHEALANKESAREAFIVERSKTPRGAATMRNMLCAYDSFCAKHEATSEEQDLPQENDGVTRIA
jgi:hypothetical protein